MTGVVISRGRIQYCVLAEMLAVSGYVAAVEVRAHGSLVTGTAQYSMNCCRGRLRCCAGAREATSFMLNSLDLEIYH